MDTVTRAFMNRLLILGLLSGIVGAGAGLLGHALALPSYASTTSFLHDGGRIDSHKESLLKQANDQAQSRATGTGIGVGLISGAVLFLMVYLLSFPAKRLE